MTYSLSLELFAVIQKMRQSPFVGSYLGQLWVVHQPLVDLVQALSLLSLRDDQVRDIHSVAELLPGWRFPCDWSVGVDMVPSNGHHPVGKVSQEELEVHQDGAVVTVLLVGHSFATCRKKNSDL